jgi:hypothetical protein
MTDFPPSADWDAGLPPPLDITAPLTPDGKVPCPVPGCSDRVTKNALGPHLKMHRNRQDPGTPPPKYKSKAKAAAAAAAKVNDAPVKRAYTPRAKPKLTPADVVDGVLTILFPVSIPTGMAREVAAWIADTERLAAAALADQAEPESP